MLYSENEREIGSTNMFEIVVFAERLIEFFSGLSPIFFGILAYLGSRTYLQLRYGRRFEGPKNFAVFYKERFSVRMRGLASSTDDLISSLKNWLRGLGGRNARMPMRVRIFFLFVGLSIVYTSIAFTISWAIVGSAEIGGITLFDSGYSALERGLISIALSLLVAASILVIAWPNPYILTNFFAKKLGENWKETEHLKEMSAQDVTDVTQLVEPVPRQKLLLTICVLVALPLAFSSYLGLDISQFYSFDSALLSELTLFHLTQVACILVIWVSITPIVAATFMASGAALLYVGFPIYLISPLLLAVSIQVSGLLPIAANSILVPAFVLGFAYFWQGQPNAILVVIAMVINIPVAIAVYSDIADRGQGRLAALLIAVPCYAAVSAILFFGDNQVSVGIMHAIFAFWLLIPFANAIWDSVSWLITWRLLRLSEVAFSEQRVRETEQGADARDLYGLILVGWAFLIISIDIGSAVLFMVAVSLSSILLVLFTNTVFASVGLTTYMSVDGIIEKISAGRFFEADTSWLWVLVVTTILPTVFHVFVSSARIFSLVVERASIKYATQQIIDTDPDQNYDRFDFYWTSAKNNVGLIVAFSVAAVFFVFGVFFSVFQSNWYGSLLRLIAPYFGLD